MQAYAIFARTYRALAFARHMVARYGRGGRAEPVSAGTGAGSERHGLCGHRLSGSFWVGLAMAMWPFPAAG